MSHCWKQAKGRPTAIGTRRTSLNGALIYLILFSNARAVSSASAACGHSVEPVFGQIKQARGFRQFLLRGIEKVRAEWAMICMAHNLTKLAKAA